MNQISKREIEGGMLKMIKREDIQFKGVMNVCEKYMLR